MDQFEGVDRNWKEAGVRHRKGSVPDPVTLEWLQTRCKEDERILRKYIDPETGLPADGGDLDPEDELELAKYPPNNISNAIRRWKYLGHIFIKRQQNLRRSQENVEEASAALRQLLLREPVQIELASRTIEITGRSYAALYQMARHQMAIRDISQTLDRISDMRGRLGEAYDEGRVDKRHVRRWYQRLRDLEKLAAEEMIAHRQAIYAHAFTESGAPADSLDQAPDWWQELGPNEDLAIMQALMEVGVVRYAKLGDPPEPKEEKETRLEREELGFVSIFSMWDKAMKVEPATSIHTDIGQLFAHMRASAEYWDLDE